MGLKNETRLFELIFFVPEHVLGLGCFQKDNKLSDFMKSREFLEQVMEY
jgi:hypothetical protein